jgi:ribosome biogenesis GTPase / thiamine phosphate phosphatase
VAVGDTVWFEMNEDNTGVIYKIAERKNYLSRKSPKVKGASYRGERLEQVIAANIDAFYIVVSVAEPYFNNKVLDRFLVAGESSNIPIKIIFNKIDLDPDSFISEWVEFYRSIGYEVFLTSCKTRKGIDELHSNLSGKKNLFWGHSGVGKSSILNSLFPKLKLLTGKVSSYSDKGMHTTVTSIMVKVESDTFVIDTPGIREIDPYGIRKEDVGHFFKEFEEFINECKFNTCTHHHEPGCSVIEAVENGKIIRERYDSYLRILETVETDMFY